MNAAQFIQKDPVRVTQSPNVAEVGGWFFMPYRRWFIVYAVLPFKLNKTLR